MEKHRREMEALEREEAEKETAANSEEVLRCQLRLATAQQRGSARAVQEAEVQLQKARAVACRQAAAVSALQNSLLHSATPPLYT